MSLDLMDLVKGAISHQVMDKFSGMMGGDQKKASSVFDNVAGSILGGMMKKAQTDDGARDVFEMVGKNDSILDKLGDLMGGDSGEQQIMKQGGGMLEGILGGGSQQNSMVATIAKALGLDEGMIGKLMMMAAPFIIGAIGKHLKAKAMDMVGFKNMLSSQGPNIAKSMAPGLGESLGFGNLLSNVPTATAAPAAPVMAQSDGGDILKYVVPLLLLVGLIIAGIFVVPRLMSGTAGPTTVINSANIDEMEKDVRGKLEQLAKDIEAIESVEDAKTVKTKIDEYRGYVAGLKFDGVSAEGMQKIKGQLDMRLVKPPLEDHAFKVEGVKELIQPAVIALSEAIEKVRAMEK